MRIREIQMSYVPRRLARGPGQITVKTSSEAARLMAPMLEPEVVEVCYVVCLTAALTLIGYHQVSRGSLTETLVHPREVYKPALLANAAGIVILHNHPSGDPTPSAEDIRMTARLKEAGDLIGIELLDHVIIGHQGRYVSFKERSCL